MSVQSRSGWLNLNRLHKILRYLTGVRIAGLHSEVAVSNTVYKADYPYRGFCYPLQFFLYNQGTCLDVSHFNRLILRDFQTITGKYLAI
jgi:hypothetical protein